LLPDDEGTTARTLGYRLRDQHGLDYYVMATEFYSGAFLALDACPGNTLQLVTHQAALPLEDTYAYRFHAEGFPLFMLDLRGVDYAQAEAAWLMGPLLMRRIGAGYCQANDRDYTRMLSLPTDYDGVIFFDGTSPTTPVGF
ncbi:MAG TPA: erythromycin esterase family protein, partial [Longimicrobiales bacterium]|nr:erythromycin esterase family protein [Longimicrobiales bacterium]